jgi:hypothetical protein
MRSDISQFPTTEQEAYRKQAQFIREVADVLRKNIVQGTRIQDPENGEGDGVYREFKPLILRNIVDIIFVGIRMTKDTELGDNNTIKNPFPMEASRSKRRTEKAQPHKFVQRYLSPSFEITLT